MKYKKNPKTDLSRNQGLNFALGLLAVLALTFIALEWKTYETPFDFSERMNIDDPIDEQVTLLDLKMPPPPPPPATPEVIEIVPDDPDIIETQFKSTEVVEEAPLTVDDIPEIIEDIDEVVPFDVIEEAPIFPGCEDVTDKKTCFQTMITKHIQKTQRYPVVAQEIGVQGRVSVMFTIQKDGNIGDLKMRGPHQSLENEAARIIDKLPKMIPGKQRGAAVKVPFSIPITFKLQ